MLCLAYRPTCPYQILPPSRQHFLTN